MKRWFGWILLAFSGSVATFHIYNLTVLARQSAQPTTSARSVAPTAPTVAPQSTFAQVSTLPIEEQIQHHLQKSKADASQSYRHRYILANLYLAQKQPQAALTALTDLENSYPLLTEYIWLKRAQALTQLGKTTEAQGIHSAILNRYPRAAVSAVVVYEQKDYSTLLQNYPSHPLAKNILKQTLKKEPNRRDLLTLLATHYNDDKDIIPYLDRLTSGNLSPEQWWAVADGYFDNFNYTKAAQAYSKSTANPTTAYRLGRSYHRADRLSDAIRVYKQVAERYPQSPEAPRALLRLMQLVLPPEALMIADRITASYPEAAPEALLEKFYLQRDVLKINPQTTLNSLVQRFPQSNAAAEVLVAIARSQAKAGKLQEAIKTVRNLILQNQVSDSAAQAGFWAGKWSEKLGDRAGGQEFYRHVLRHHPESYYAWRSATALGWTVGSLGGVRQINYNLQPIGVRQPLPSGSPVLQELFLLGQDQDAQQLWQFTTRGKRVLNVREIFTDGVMRVLGGDYLLGIRQLSSLEWVDVSPTEAAQLPALIDNPTRAAFLYPLAYRDIVQPRSEARNLSSALVFGLIRQESRFEANIRSSADALGLMQVIPETGAWIAGKTGRKSYNLRNPQDNVEFGTWYLDYTHHTYNENSMLAIASYNAGPGAVAGWVKGGIGDPDEFVEKIPYSETRDYVKKVFGNYWNYLRLYSPEIQAQLSQVDNNKQK